MVGAVCVLKTCAQVFKRYCCNLIMFDAGSLTDSSQHECCVWSLGQGTRGGSNSRRGTQSGLPSKGSS